MRNTLTLKGNANGYGQEHETSDGGKCPLCGCLICEESRFCRGCAALFAAWLQKALGRKVKFAKPRELTGGVVVAGRRNWQRTLETLRANGTMTTVDLARAVGMTPEGVRYQLRRMLDTGEVLFVEGGYGHIWKANGKD